MWSPPQGACKYWLARTCRGGSGADAAPSFSAKVINDARRSKHFSWTKSLSLRLPGARVRGRGYGWGAN